MQNYDCIEFSTKSILNHKCIYLLFILTDSILIYLKSLEFQNPLTQIVETAVHCGNGIV